MLDRNIEFHSVYMRRKSKLPLKEYAFPEGFKKVMYKPGDENDWAAIETSVGEFKSTKKALAFYKNKYLKNPEELEKRCMFVENERGKKVGTFTAWKETLDGVSQPWVSWVAVKPGYQKRGIGKALVYEGMKLMFSIEGVKDVYLRTQTWSHKAVNIYRDQGFDILEEVEDCGYSRRDYERMMMVLEKYLKNPIDSN